MEWSDFRRPDRRVQPQQDFETLPFSVSLLRDCICPFRVELGVVAVRPAGQTIYGSPRAIRNVSL